MERVLCMDETSAGPFSGPITEVEKYTRTYNALAGPWIIVDCQVYEIKGRVGLNGGGWGEGAHVLCFNCMWPHLMAHLREPSHLDPLDIFTSLPGSRHYSPFPPLPLPHRHFKRSHILSRAQHEEGF